MSTHTPGPIPDSYWVPGRKLAAGEYPGAPDGAYRAEKLGRLLEAGIDVFVDLTTDDDPLLPYAAALTDEAAARGMIVEHVPSGIPDMGVTDAAHMNEILDVIDAHLALDRGVYVHCWGGIGRTGTVVGCHLVRHGMPGEGALAEVQRLFETMSAKKVARHRAWGSPQTEQQRAMVRGWASHDRLVRKRSGEMRVTPLRDRYVGALVGLAVCDALGTTLEFTSPGGFTPVEDMVGGGPFGLAPGEWTDDTSMAMCLAESLVEKHGFDARDQMDRYVRWWREGYWSSRDSCFDIGNTVRAALARYVNTGDPFAGSTDPGKAGNGSLMRLAPVPLFFATAPLDAIAWSAESSRTTHAARTAIDACRYFAALIVGALDSVRKEDLLAERFTPVKGLWEREPLCEPVDAVARGSFRTKRPPEIRGGAGYVVHTLEAALWAFASTNDFRSGALAAVNLGGDADTTGAVYGQLAGAYYGVEAIPPEWRERLVRGDEIVAMAERLYAAAAPV